MPFPSGGYTPFGYLRNPSHRAESWRTTHGGNLRSATDGLGVEWVYPLQRDPTAAAGILLEASIDGRVTRTRAEFDALGLTSNYHSCLILGFGWRHEEVQVAARYFLVTDDALCVRLELSNSGAHRRAIDLTLTRRVWPSDAACPYQHAFEGDGRLLLELEPGHTEVRVAVLGRGADAAAAEHAVADALRQSETKYTGLLAEDDTFYATCPRLAGDWPTGWREGLIYDFETTRALVQPAGGIFSDVWPAWMLAWPRVVLAEGALDMLRLAYADPALAQRAILSMFRDAPAPNVPCVFQDGAYNMLAADGSRCGTSPAWCLPFLNLELVYLRTLDRAWLEQLYRYLVAYVEWWLEHRTDADGWLVYKCTWESGEDGNPRLDPSGSGDADISHRVRPVELQATLAHAAGVLAFFAAQLGQRDDIARWRRVERAFRRRTRQLFDPESGRYCDWLMAERRFQPPRPDQPYWGLDTCRYSAQSLTPLLLGEPLARDEVLRHATAPWLLWPSWTYTFVESAAAGDLLADVGRLVAETIERVYRVTTRRELGSLARPMPGAAPEFWPEDWRTFQGSDAYGWGATTANLLIRHLFGFKESRVTSRWSAVLTPAFPKPMLEPGRRYTIRNLLYRGSVFDLSYVVLGDRLRAELELRDAKRCRVRAARTGKLVYASRRPALRHQFELGVGEPVQLDLA